MVMHKGSVMVRFIQLYSGSELVCLYLSFSRELFQYGLDDLDKFQWFLLSYVQDV